MPRRRRPPRPGALTDLSPFRILKQIVLLQFFYYATALILIVFTSLAAGKHMTLDLILGWQRIRGDVTEGWMLGLVWMLNSLVSVVFILLLIARSKLVADFAITIHLIHLIVTSLYSHAIPTNFFWWALQVASTMLMVVLGMWSCQWRELRPINFGKSSDGGEASGSTAFGDILGQAADRVAGFDSDDRRKNDNKGEYEMVPR